MSSASGSAPANKKQYTLGEVSKHNSKTSCWMVIHKKVYDVTDFVTEVHL